MDYHLYSLGQKNLPTLKLLVTGSQAVCNEMMSVQLTFDKKNEYAVYDDGGRLVSSTFSGGATPHAWGLREKGESRKLSGLSGFKKKYS